MKTPLSNWVKKNKTLSMVVLAIIILFLVLLILKPTPPPKPDVNDLIHEPAFRIPAWDAAAINRICLDGKVVFPSETLGLRTSEFLAQFFHEIGMQVVSIGEKCDATLLVELEGKGLSARYGTLPGSSGKGCTTGFNLEGRIVLSANDLPDQIYEVDERKETTESISENQCQTWYRYLLDQEWKSQMRRAMTGIWDANVYIHYYNAFERPTGGFPCLFPASPEYVPVAITLMMRNEEYPDLMCVNVLAKIGPPAEDAVPYLLYLLGTRNEENVPVENFIQALRSITGEDPGETPAAWWRWWAKKSKEVQ